MAEVIREAVLIRTAGVRKCCLRMSAPHTLVKWLVHFRDRTPTVQGTTGLPSMCTEPMAQDVYTIPSIHFLRRALYAFSRLLAIPIDESFVCENCGPCPDIIVCDGTMIGMRTHLMVPKNDSDESKLVPACQGKFTFR